MNSTLVTIARPGDDPAIDLVYATVTGRADRWFLFDAAGRAPLRALRAESCLVEPECGDTVLVAAGGANAISYVIAVLARAQRSGAALVLPGDVALHTDNGALRFEAASVDVNAEHSLKLHAPDITMTGERGELKFQRVEAAIQQLHAGFGTVSTVAQQVTSTVGRLIQRARDSVRWIDNDDETRAGRVRMQVEERLHVSARHATILAEGQVKIDADKIDLG
ncbi:hypothetical protein BTHE68_65190 (plasmid) [Burkholderia sp. THE68]|uniref:DUF3540 domain-containing protein n=1 Tax=Burkholderia sp. THE68 TaxID=758782 RepID=UPI001315DC1A|nr:DUF3540 domain-containing protein [Burkholderia sp. THE68]BBU32785.1 hypothetical protein BTHE68_65190 [Burkholderia sp. THE68]